MDFIAGYESWLGNEKRAAANTLSSYLRDVRQFALWAQEDELPLTQVEQEDVRRYAHYLEKKGRGVIEVFLYLYDCCALCPH